MIGSILIIGFAILLLVLIIVLVNQTQNKCKTLTNGGKTPFCGCSSKGSVDDIKFDGTSLVTGFFYQLRSPNVADVSPLFPGIAVIDLYKDDDRFIGQTRFVTGNMVFWMDQTGVSSWVSGAEIYTNMINKCYPNDNPVTELSVNNENNRSEWTIKLPTMKIEEAIDAMNNGKFKYGPTITLVDVDSWKCCA
jgi:hypothetical protein